MAVAAADATAVVAALAGQMGRVNDVSPKQLMKTAIVAAFAPQHGSPATGREMGGQRWLQT